MSFAKIAEARAVKKIVTWLRYRKRVFSGSNWQPNDLIDYLAQEIERGKWKDVKLPKPKKGKK